MSTAVGFIEASVVASIRWRVTGLRFTCSDTKSLSASKVLERQVRGAEGPVDLSRELWTSWYRIRIPKPWRAPRDGLADPPEPNDPEGRAVNVGPEESIGPQVFQRPART